MTNSTATMDAQPATARTQRASRIWHLVILINVIAALAIQLMLILTGGPDPNTGETVASVGVTVRMVQTLSFFTIQSNILVLIVAALLVADPDRDGRIWRVLRLSTLMGIAITGLVFETVLIRYVHPEGWQLAATIGLHYVSPWAMVIGWLLFGPRGLIDRRTAVWAFAWPLAWAAYTFVHGAIAQWYPYPFIDVEEIGYLKALAATAVVLAIGVAFVAAFSWLDRRIHVVWSAPRTTR